MTVQDTKRLFDTIRHIKGDALTQADVDAINRALAPTTSAYSGSINEAGCDIIKRFEGKELTSYICPAGILTIGYGSTGPHVKKGMKISEVEAEALLRKDLERFEKGVAHAVGNNPTTDNQYSAMVSLAFNIGLEAFQKSTLLKLHNAGLYNEAADQFDRWVRGGGKVLPGLVKRRAAEKALYEERVK